MKATKISFLTVFLSTVATVALGVWELKGNCDPDECITPSNYEDLNLNLFHHGIDLRGLSRRCYGVLNVTCAKPGKYVMRNGESKVTVKCDRNKSRWHLPTCDKINEENVHSPPAIEVFVNGRPYYELSDEGIVVEEGSRVALSCKNQRLHENAIHRWHDHRQGPGNTGKKYQRLLLDGVTKADKGRYSCSRKLVDSNEEYVNSVMIDVTGVRPCSLSNTIPCRRKRAIYEPSAGHPDGSDSSQGKRNIICRTPWIKNGYIRGRPSHRHYSGSRVDVSCMRGYSFSGSSGSTGTIWCTTNGEWSMRPDELCYINGCHHPQSIPDTTYRLSRGPVGNSLGAIYPIGTEVTYHCNNHRTLVGVSKKTCVRTRANTEGEWSPGGKTECIYVMKMWSW